MKIFKITTPENIEVEYELAGLGARTAAAVIDLLIQSIFLVLLLIAVVLISSNFPRFFRDTYGWIIGIALLLAAVFSYGYSIFMELGMNGATLGKKAMKLRVVRDNGQPVTLKHSAIRNLFKLFIDLYGIGTVMIFFSGTCKRLGDYAASTIVIIQKDSKIPVTLDALLSMNAQLKAGISQEEQQLLMNYLSRRHTFHNNVLRDELKLYFTRKFEDRGILKEWEDFIDQL